MGLKEQAIGSVKWTSVATLTASALQLIQVAVLTRFLDKEDFGLMALAIFVIGISRIFIDMGISNSIIHKQHINKYQLSSLFWLNILVGIILFLIIILLTPYIAQFYNNEELNGVINLTAVSFLILPWGQQFEALLRKNLEFKSLSIQRVIARVGGFVIAIIFAYKGFGVYALVYANLTTVFISALLLIIMGLKFYKPKFLFSYRSLKGKGFFSFGLFQMGEQLINYFNTNFDTILIGKLLGMDMLGLYNIAKIFALKPYQILNPIITNVAFPVFSKIQGDIKRLKRLYLKVVNLLVNLNAPIYLMIIILAKPMVIIAFGQEWIKAVPILQLLAIGSLFRSIGNPVGSLQLARGRADWGFYWNLGVFAIVPTAIYIGSSYGIIGVAFALVIYRIIVILFPFWFFLIKPLCKASYKEYSTSFVYPILIAILSGIIPFIIINTIKMNIYLQFIIGSFLYLGINILLNLYINKTFIKEIKELIKFRLKKV